MKRFYKIDAYMRNGKQLELTKTNLISAFYCLRECINSGLYREIYFTVYEKDETNKYLLNEKCFLPSGDGFIKWTKRANWYYNRFKKYIQEYGTTKEISFIKGV